MQYFKPTKVILHCSATQDYPRENKAFDIFGAKDIDAWHRKKGWNGCGYHWIIRKTGILEDGRSLTQRGAHAYGHNTNSFGICLIGSKLFTDEQIQSLLKLYGIIYRNYGISWENWQGHYELTNRKTCPNIAASIMRNLLKQYHENHFS